jgi:NDP-sugar pyrophosphorylase family protein
MSEESAVTASNAGAARGLRAVILAGGKGVRLQPFTINFPKPLVPLGDIPIIEVLIRRLITFGLTDVTLTLGHLAGLIKAYFHHRQELSRQLTLHFVEEDEPTGTAGSLALVPGLTDTFLVMNGDVLTDLNFATHRRIVKIDFGLLEFGDDHLVTGYREKPEYRHDVSMGIYVYEPRALGFIEPGKYLDFPDLVLKLVRAGEKVCAWPFEGLWLDIGRTHDYAEAQQLFADRPRVFLNEMPEEI